MSGNLTVLIVCLILLAGTFACGYAPAMISAPKKVMNLIAIYGGGMIIGAAIVIILPEAASILINAQYELNELKEGDEHDHDHEHTMPEEHDHDHDHHHGVVGHDVNRILGTCILLGFLIMLVMDEIITALTHRETPASSPLDEENQEMQSLLVPDKAIAQDKKLQRTQEEERINASLLTTVALCMHSLTEGVAMGASLWRKLTIHPNRV